MNRLTLEYTKLTACIFYGSDSECKNEYDEKKLNIVFKVVEQRKKCTTVLNNVVFGFLLPIQ